MSAIELLPCPFCGGTELSHGHDMGRGVVQCHPCNAYVVVGDEEDSIAAWNRRTDLSQASVAAALEAAAQTVDTLGDSAVTEALGARLCCDGHMCGCQGADVGTYILHAIRALITPAQHDALAAHVAAEVAKARAEDAAKIKALVIASDNLERIVRASLPAGKRSKFAVPCRAVNDALVLFNDAIGAKP